MWMSHLGTELQTELLTDKLLELLEWLFATKSNVNHMLPSSSLYSSSQRAHL